MPQTTLTVTPDQARLLQQMIDTKAAAEQAAGLVLKALTAGHVAAGAVLLAVDVVTGVLTLHDPTPSPVPLPLDG